MTVSTIVTTAGSASANSYISVVDASTYFADRLNATVWESASADDKARALLQAAKNIDSLSFSGMKWKSGAYGTSEFQAMAWPRYAENADPFMLNLPHLIIEAKYSEWYDSSNTPIVPRQIKFAQCEQAIFLLLNMVDLDKRKALHSMGVVNYSIESVSEQNSGIFNICVAAAHILSSLNCMNSSMRIDRA